MRQGRDTYPIGQFSLIAVGGNVTSVWGDPQDTVRRACELVAQRLGGACDVSPLYNTPAFPAGAGPDFVNGAIRCETTRPAAEILAVLHEIEAAAGRTREVRWGQRTLDLDLIACGDQILPDAAGFELWRQLPLDEQAKQAPTQLILPHPRLQDRSFVLIPLADVAPDWVHPVLGRTVVQMRDARPAQERATVLPL